MINIFKPIPHAFPSGKCQSKLSRDIISPQSGLLSFKKKKQQMMKICGKWKPYSLLIELN